MVLELRKIAIRLVGVGHVMLLVWLYLYGSNGFAQLHDLKATCRTYDMQIAQLKQEIAALEHDIIEWNIHPFYKEKYAREQLQMARKDEIIYRLPGQAT